MTNVQRMVVASALTIVVYLCTVTVYRNWLALAALLGGAAFLALYAHYLKHRGGPQ